MPCEQEQRAHNASVLKLESARAAAKSKTTEWETTIDRRKKDGLLKELNTLLRQVTKLEREAADAEATWKRCLGVRAN